MTVRQNLTWIGLSAVATMGLTLALFSPTNLSAVEEVKPATASIYAPTLAIGKISIVTQLAAKSDKTDAKDQGSAAIPVGPIPAMQLVATNKGDTDADAQFVATASIMSLRDNMSRSGIVRPPVAIQEFAFKLKPGETRTLDLKVPGSVEANGSVAISLVAGTKEVVTKTLEARVRPARNLNAKAVSANPVSTKSAALNIGQVAATQKLDDKIVASAAPQNAPAPSQQAK